VVRELEFERFVATGSKKIYGNATAISRSRIPHGREGMFSPGDLVLSEKKGPACGVRRGDSTRNLRFLFFLRKKFD
jgi:hypothetical protein